MSSTHDKLSRIAAHQRLLLRRKEEALRLRVTRAYDEVRRLVDSFLELDPAISKIILFGSLARCDVSSADFDIDLAVSCSGEQYLALVACALDSPFKVDLVDISSADSRILSSIDRDGKVLYEK